MTRTIFTYGILAGVIVAVCMAIGMSLGFDSGPWGMAVGYLGMLVALTMVYVGIRKYRNQELGGAIRFPTALGVGLGISAIATLAYALGWEAYLYATDYRFMPDYIAATLEAKRAAGATPAELAKLSADLQGYLTMYENPVKRIPLTMSEIAPVALLVTLISAFLLRYPKGSKVAAA